MGKKKSNETEIMPFDDYTELTVEEDIYHGLDEKPKKKPIFNLIIILIVLVVGITGVIAFSNFRFITPIQRSIGNTFEKTTGFFAEREEQNRIKGILQENGLEKETNVIPYENAAVSSYISLNSNVIATRANYIAELNKKGKVLWETATSVAEPLIDAAGNYIVLADEGGKGICLYHKNKLVYSIQAQNPILTVDVSSDGDAVVTTDKEFYKGAVEVFNKNGRQVFSWNSGSEYVLNASISESSRRLAIVLLNADEKVKTNIQFFDINKSTGYHTATFENSAVLSAKFIGNVLDVTGDNCIAGLKQSGSTKWYTEYKENQLLSFAMDLSGNKILTLETNAVPSIHVYAENGNLLTSFETEDTPGSVDIMGRNIIYNMSRDIYFGVPGKEKHFTASMDVKKLKIIDASSFLVVYNNSLEFINTGQQQ